MVNYARQHSLEVQHHNYTSNLVVTRVRPSDAGTYSCEPHLATPANVTVHVFTGKTPAAMQHGRNQVDGGGTSTRPSLFVVLVSSVILLLATRRPLATHTVTSLGL
ncbi:uncharacterized protein LOC135092943 [Scylla paramamosain]|uniref:uncharacterized protein LOC135092943 n=1 Tax=Scylla paramamosain TaxID=85552 RepID=UPI003082924F